MAKDKTLDTLLTCLEVLLKHETAVRNGGHMYDNRRVLLRHKCFAKVIDGNKQDTTKGVMDIAPIASCVRYLVLSSVLGLACASYGRLAPESGYRLHQLHSVRLRRVRALPSHAHP